MNPLDRLAAKEMERQEWKALMLEFRSFIQTHPKPEQRAQKWEMLMAAHRQKR